MTLSAQGPSRVVLVVEDDPPVRELLTGAINDEPGYLAVGVPDGAKAMRALDAVNADLVLLDLQLPGLSGIEVIDRMRTDERLRDLPVIVQTATAGLYAQDMRDRGIAAYIRKPFDLNEVVGLVKRLAPAA